MPKVKETYADEKKQFIIQCTMDVLKEKNIHQLTMRDVIKKTGFSQGTIYQYYKNLNQILNVITCDYMEKMKKEIEKCVNETPDFYQCYARICDCMISLYKDSPVMFEAVLGTVSFSKEEDVADEILHKIYLVGEELNQVVICLLKKGMENGIVDKGLNLYVTVSYMWSSIGQAILFSDKKREYIRQQFGILVEEYRRQCFEMILKSIS